MQCANCEQQAIALQPNLCKDHFDEYILQTTQATIEEFNLFTKQDKICVAVSGGKDSLALLDVLTRLGYTVTGLFVDEGIVNYREYAKEDLDNFIKQKNIPLLTTSFEELTGQRLDSIMQTGKFHACTVCGTLRRYLLNKHSKDYDVLATGHNQDDEAQTIMINLARGNTDLLFRMGPITKRSEHFTRKVKPFYRLSEKQLLIYTTLHNIKTHFGECPYAHTSYRSNLRDELNKLEVKQPGTKKNIIDTYLKLQARQTTTEHKEHLGTCTKCGEASQDTICKTCKFKEEIEGLFTAP